MLCGERVSQRMNLSWSVSSALKCKSLSVVVSHPNVMEGMLNILYNVMWVAKSSVCDALVDRAMDAKCECVAGVIQWMRSATAR